MRRGRGDAINPVMTKLNRTARLAGVIIMAAAGVAGYTPSSLAQGPTQAAKPVKPKVAKSTTRRTADSTVKPKKSTVAAPVWPVDSPTPLSGALLPAKRIVAFYGNPLAKRMGILGELPPDEMLAKLDREVAAWNAADPATPVQPALHLIAVVASDSPGKSGKYRTRMDSALIEKVYGWAQKKNAILFLDVQVGQGTLQEELPRLRPFLKRPDVHLGIDPEFSMKGTHVPGTKIGTFDANDVNYASSLLQDIVTEEHVPPKVLVVHRFTRDMLTGYRRIKLDPQRADRRQHGRLGPAVAQARVVSRLRLQVPGRIHGLQALLQERHEEGRQAHVAGLRARAESSADLHPVPVARRPDESISSGLRDSIGHDDRRLVAHGEIHGTGDVTSVVRRLVQGVRLHYVGSLRHRHARAQEHIGKTHLAVVHLHHAVGVVVVRHHDDSGTRTVRQIAE